MAIGGPAIQNFKNIPSPQALGREGNKNNPEQKSVAWMLHGALV